MERDQLHRWSPSRKPVRHRQIYSQLQGYFHHLTPFLSKITSETHPSESQSVNSWESHFQTQCERQEQLTRSTGLLRVNIIISSSFPNHASLHINKENHKEYHTQQVPTWRGKLAGPEPSCREAAGRGGPSRTRGGGLTIASEIRLDGLGGTAGQDRKPGRGQRRPHPLLRPAAPNSGTP